MSTRAKRKSGWIYCISLYMFFKLPKEQDGGIQKQAKNQSDSNPASVLKVMCFNIKYDDKKLTVITLILTARRTYLMAILR